MSTTSTVPRLRRLRWAFGIVLSFATVCTSYAAPKSPGTSAIVAPGEHTEGLDTAADGTLHLSATAPPATLAETFQRYGFFISTPQSFSSPSTRLILSYDAAIPPGTALYVDVRTSADGRRWTDWTTEAASGAPLDLPHAAQMAQYRVRMFGSADNGPSLHAITVQPVAGPAPRRALDVQLANGDATIKAEAAAPTFRVHATRMGMVGGRTANGWIIPPRGHFVSLPSWRSLSTRNGREYQVRLSYNGRSTVVPVMDVGPWNAHDDYWSSQRERYNDLPRGWPQDHAAFYQKHNGGRAEKGYVRFPTAIDVGDGVWWDDLKIKGDRAEVEITFLWLGNEPQVAEPPPPDPNASEFVVDELSSAFKGNGRVWYSSPSGCGEGGHAYWTIGTSNPAKSENSARWQPALPTERLYDVYVHVPICPNKRTSSEQARYQVQHRDGTQDIVVNQAQQTHWVHLGRFPFAAGDKGFIQLTDVTGDDDRAVWFDQARWVPVP